MPIKEQCNNCRYQMDNHCTQLAPTFDGASCGVYKKRINLEKEKEELQEAAAVVSDTQGDNYIPDNDYSCDDENVPSDESIHGWLKFFLIVPVGIGSVFTLISNFVTFDSDDNFWIALSDPLLSAVYLAAGICTLAAFHKRDTDAVFLAKTFVVLCFVTNLLALLAIDGGETSTTAVTDTISSIIWSCIWFIYLFKSEQVKRIIPKGYRKTKTRDWLIISAAVLLPLICIGLGISTEQKAHTESEAAALSNLSLSENQFTDGRIILTVPDGVDCEESYDEEIGTTFFSISDPETGAGATVVSDYDNDISKKSFNKYWLTSQPGDLNELEHYTVKDDKYSHGDVTVFYKVTRINADLPLDWKFALLFDHNTGKACIVSGYSIAHNDDSPVEYIINNLKFL